MAIIVTRVLNVHKHTWHHRSPRPKTKTIAVIKIVTFPVFQPADIVDSLTVLITLSYGEQWFFINAKRLHSTKCWTSVFVESGEKAGRLPSSIFGEKVWKNNAGYNSGYVWDDFEPYGASWLGHFKILQFGVASRSQILDQIFSQLILLQ